MSSSRSSCEECGQSRDLEKPKAQLMPWGLPFDPKTRLGISYILFVNDTKWVPAYKINKLWDESKPVNRNGKHRVWHISRLIPMLKAQYPALSAADLRPYWSRFLTIEDFDEAERLLNIIKRQNGKAFVGDGVELGFEGDYRVYTIAEDDE